MNEGLGLKDCIKEHEPENVKNYAQCCREMYASEWLNHLIEIKERELSNLVELRNMLPTQPTEKQNKAIRELIK